MRIQLILIILLISNEIFSQTTRTYDMDNPDTERFYGIGLRLIGDNGYKLNFFSLFPGDEIWDCEFSCGSFYQLGNMLYMKDSVRGFEMEFEVFNDSILIARKAFVNMVKKPFRLNRDLYQPYFYTCCPPNYGHNLAFSSNYEYGQKKYVSFPTEGCYGLSSEEFALKLYYINHRYEFVFHEVIISEGEWFMNNGEIVFKDRNLEGNFNGVFYNRGLEVNILSDNLFFVNAVFPKKK